LSDRATEVYPETKPNSSGARPQPRLTFRVEEVDVSATLVAPLRAVLPLLIVMFAATPAHAGPTNTDPPPPGLAPASSASAWTTTDLDIDSQGNVVGVLELSEEAVASTEVGTLCKKVKAVYTKTNGAPGPLSNDLWKYGATWGWCWKTGTHTISSLYGWARIIQCCDPGWDFKGNTSLSTTGWVGSKTVTRRTQGHFAFCPPVAGCVNHNYPWVKLFLYGTGGWNATKGNA
jgi:hypothetical protein